MANTKHPGSTVSASPPTTARLVVVCTSANATGKGLMVDPSQRTRPEILRLLAKVGAEPSDETLDAQVQEILRHVKHNGRPGYALVTICDEDRRSIQWMTRLFLQLRKLSTAKDVEIWLGLKRSEFLPFVRQLMPGVELVDWTERVLPLADVSKHLLEKIDREKAIDQPR